MNETKIYIQRNRIALILMAIHIHTKHMKKQYIHYLNL